MDTVKPLESFFKEAVNISSSINFQKFTSVKFRNMFKVTHTKDFKKGLKIGYTLGITYALCEKAYFNKLCEIVHDFIDNSRK